MKKIEIYIACHKPSELPANDLFKPIHVGSKNSKVQLPGLVRDDEGDNISEKNPNYCEMTAQYWAWKHSDAEYIGLCHYRRFLCLSEKQFTNYTPDFRKQIYALSLTPETEEKYGLLDEEQMRRVIEANDIIVCTAQDLSKVNTPFGPQKTTLKHWTAHDMALINIDDLKELFQIVKSDYPQIYKSMNEYLHGKYFYGFNTFIMRRDLFLEMCAFEFDVLEKLERRVDISQYNQQLSRIYGFMGEILFSSFVYYIQKTRQEIRIKECPIVYFDETDPIQNLSPELETKTPIVLDLENKPPFLLHPLIYTFLQHVNQQTKYEVIILGEKVSNFYKKYYSNLFKEYSNVTLKYQETHLFKAYIKELYGRIPVFHSVFLPWILPKYDSCLYIKWNTLVQKNIDSLLNISADSFISGVKDVYYQGRLNTFYKEDKVFAKNVLKIENIFDCINPNVLVMNLQHMRVKDIDEISGRIKEYCCTSHKIHEVEICNALWQKEISFLPVVYNWLINSNDDINFYIGESPLQLASEYKKSKNDAAILSYDTDFPWNPSNDIEAYLIYWKIIKQGELTEVFYQYRIQHHIENFSVKPYLWKLINTLLPKETKRRTAIKKLFPKTGTVRTTLRNIIDK